MSRAPAPGGLSASDTTGCVWVHPHAKLSRTSSWRTFSKRLHPLHHDRTAWRFSPRAPYCSSARLLVARRFLPRSTVTCDRSLRSRSMNREKFLIVHGIDSTRWARRFDIQPFTRACGECGALLTTSVPFVHGTLRGLLAPTCACGNTKTPYCVVRDYRYGDLLTSSTAEGPKVRAARRSDGRVLHLQRPPCSTDQ